MILNSRLGPAPPPGVVRVSESEVPKGAASEKETTFLEVPREGPPRMEDMLQLGELHLASGIYVVIYSCFCVCALDPLSRYEEPPETPPDPPRPCRAQSRLPRCGELKRQPGGIGTWTIEF